MALSKELQAQDDANLCKLQTEIEKELAKRRNDKLAEFHQSNDYKKLKAASTSLAAKGDKLRKR